MFQGRLGMVSLWMENGTLQEYIQTNPDVDRHDLASVFSPIQIISQLTLNQCVQVTAGVSYIHSIYMVGILSRCMDRNNINIYVNNIAARYMAKSEQ